MSPKNKPPADMVNALLSAATNPSWHSRQGGWAVWSFEYGTPAHRFVTFLNDLWRTEKSLARKLGAIRPYLPHDVYKRAVIYSTLRWAKYLPPLQFRDGLIVEARDREAMVLLPDPVNLSLIIPSPALPSKLLHVFLNYPESPSGPVKVLSVWLPQESIQALVRNVLLAMPTGKPSQTLGKLIYHISRAHPEDLGVIGPWDPHTLAVYVTLIAEVVRKADPDTLLTTAMRYSKLGEDRR